MQWSIAVKLHRSPEKGSQVSLHSFLRINLTPPVKILNVIWRNIFELYQILWRHCTPISVKEWHMFFFSLKIKFWSIVQTANAKTCRMTTCVILLPQISEIWAILTLNIKNIFILWKSGYKIIKWIKKRYIGCKKSVDYNHTEFQKNIPTFWIFWSALPDGPKNILNFRLTFMINN